MNIYVPEDLVQGESINGFTLKTAPIFMPNMVGSSSSRIRHGSFNRNTSLAIPVILAVMLENKGYEVDFHLLWGLPHFADYDLPQLFAWIDEICLGAES